MEYVEAGCGSVTFHVEAAKAPVRLAREIRAKGARAAMALKPATPVEPYEELLPELDMLLVMTVEPGFGGQTFLDLCLPKIRTARQLMEKHGVETWLQVDGGVSLETIERCAEAGADVFVAGSAVYSADDPDRMVAELRATGRGGHGPVASRHDAGGAGRARVVRQPDHHRGAALPGLRRRRGEHVLVRAPAQAVARVARRGLSTTSPSYDLVGDVHGCRSELDSLLTALGWQGAQHPDGRTAVFVGDLVDRGPDTPGVLRRVMAMVRRRYGAVRRGQPRGQAGPGADRRRGPHQPRAAGVARPAGRRAGRLPLGRPRLPGRPAHPAQSSTTDGSSWRTPGCARTCTGVHSPRARAFALYGDTTGRSDEHGLPVRLPWQRDYRGRARVVYGHTAVTEAEWVNNTLCLDTGVVFGGRLTALRYPELELVDVPAEREWCPPSRPLAPVTR